MRDNLKDKTIVQVVGMACISAVALGAIIIDGQTGNAIAMSLTGVIGAGVGAVWESKRCNHGKQEN